MTSESSVDDVCQLLNHMLRSLIGDTETFTVTPRLTGEASAELVVAVPEGPKMGRIIGKQGRTAKALRVIILAAGRKHRMNFQLDINGQQISDGEAD